MAELHGRALVMGGLALAGACSSGGGGSDGFDAQSVTVHGSGILIDENRPVSGFARVAYFTEGALYIEQSAAGVAGVPLTLITLDGDGSLEVGPLVPQETQAVGETLLVRAEDNLLPYLLTEVHGGVLELRTAPNTDLEPTLPIEFLLTVVSLESIDFEGIGSLSVEELTTDELELSCSGLGSVDVSNLSASELHVSIGGLGELRASGAVNRQTVTLQGFGSYDARDLQSKEADVLVGAFATATVRVSDLLIATVKSGGSVFYIGNPTVESTLIGTGTIEQIVE